MKDFFAAAKYLVVDMASTLCFLALFFLTHNTLLSVSLGVALGVVQIGLQLIRGKQVATMEWLSLFLIIAAGGTTLYTNDPRFVLIKPSVFYAIVGVVMLKPGWLNRYLPDIVKQVTPDVATAVGYYWAALMFVSAAFNAYVALTRSLAEWAMVMPIYGIVSKLVVFTTGFLAIRVMTRRRVRALPEAERDALLAASGYQAGFAGRAASPATGTTS
jgi:intracellular septation protein